MTKSSGLLAAASLLLTLLAAGPLAGAAEAQSSTTTPVLTIGTSDAAVSRRVDLTMGRSLIVDLPRDAKEVFVANPAVANAVVRSTRKVFVIGMAEGATSIFVMDAEGRQIAALDVVIARELKLSVLRQTLEQSFPNARFDVRSAGDSVILSGMVASATDASRALDLANAFVGISGGGQQGAAGPAAAAAGAGAIARGTVINNLTIRERDQVMLRVTVVEVSRTVLKQFGVSLSGGWSNLDLVNAAPFPLFGAQFPLGNQISAKVVGAGGASLTATLKAFEQAGVSRILAEPTLTAISGEAAKFTAGGQLPVPGALSCSATTTGGAQSCVPSINFKPYGVSLTFTPIVLAENRISVRVGTEVIEIDQQNSANFTSLGESTAVPAFTVRSSETTVELASGATMMTAGLIQQRNKTAINGLPGLINLPILGALFRSRDYQRQETELMILVTPFIAKPMQPSQVKRPDDGFVDASDPQGILLGRINQLYGKAGGSPIGHGYRGRVGFIND